MNLRVITNVAIKGVETLLTTPPKGHVAALRLLPGRSPLERHLFDVLGSGGSSISFWDSYRGMASIPNISAPRAFVAAALVHLKHLLATGRIHFFAEIADLAKMIHPEAHTGIFRNDGLLDLAAFNRLKEYAKIAPEKGLYWDEVTTAVHDQAAPGLNSLMAKRASGGEFGMSFDALSRLDSQNRRYLPWEEIIAIYEGRAFKNKSAYQAALQRTQVATIGAFLLYEGLRADSAA